MRTTQSRGMYSSVAYFIGYLLRIGGAILLIIGRGFGAAAVIAGVLIVPVTWLIKGFAPILIALSIILVGSSIYLVAVVLGSFLSRTGKKFTTNKAEDLLRQDPRNPVLYLRSFVDDRLAAKAVPGDPQEDIVIWKSLSLAFATDTEEEVLADELKRIGPCIAVGIPGERLPPVGMSRLYFSDNDWEDAVLALMKRSELVVMRAAKTRGFLIELEMAVKYIEPKRLIILLPYTERYKYREFKESADRVLPKELPHFSGDWMPRSRLSGVIHFQRDWTPTVLRLSDLGNTFRESLETMSKRYINIGLS